MARKRSIEKAIKRPLKKTIENTKKAGALDVPFLILVLVLMGIGILMLFSASYASAYYENLPSTYYFMRQGIFAESGYTFRRRKPQGND